jgi:hypothetical protein
MHNINSNKITVYYSLRDIQEEVFKRTSMIARGENAIRYNELVFSKGEKFLFGPYLINIASEIFDFISPFCKVELTGLEMSSEINPACIDENIINDPINDIQYTFSRMDWYNENAIQMTDVAIFESLVNGIIWQWLSIFGENELSTKYNAMYQMSITNMRNRLNSQKKPVRRKYTWF